LRSCDCNQWLFMLVTKLACQCSCLLLHEYLLIPVMIKWYLSFTCCGIFSLLNWLSWFFWPLISWQTADFHKLHLAWIDSRKSSLPHLHFQLLLLKQCHECKLASNKNRNTVNNLKWWLLSSHDSLFAIYFFLLFYFLLLYCCFRDMNMEHFIGLVYSIKYNKTIAAWHWQVKFLVFFLCVWNSPISFCFIPNCMLCIFLSSFLDENDDDFSINSMSINGFLKYFLSCCWIVTIFVLK